MIHDYKSFVKHFFDFFSSFFGICTKSLDIKSLFTYNIPMNREVKIMADDKIKYPEVGQRIRELREMRGFEQLDIANELGYKSQSTISKWESGVNLPTGKKLILLAEMLDTSTDYILHGKANDISPLPTPTIDLSNLRERVVLFDGKPLSDEDVEKITKIIELSLEVSASEDR
ncbi:helix-turn-helix domain-containing protein [Streptococcus suis]|nr:helix-turn-helix domain-containing protein [Streptococcus suis]AGF87340.1 putative transcriptional regulator [Streptococcus phage phi20c]MCO0824738.1 helix-turn-helix domain-containing protein [Streptococcus suis]MCO0826777.1 helix-turn-helix domain-containing protein [Streptococcus suis]MCO0845437.1 helix-turn-helix domain-containing protein [Streptococcus suis]MCO0852871.1 helix-turn-helix domain-containing protein [Streptococcus suis]